MVAFGTRCARRLARYTFDDEDSKLSNHVLALAERAAGLGKPLDAVSAVQAAYDNWSRIFHEISGNRGDATDWARADSAFAISAANAGKLIAKPDPHLATQIIAELEYVEESSVDLNGIRAEIFEDYDRLLKAAERNGWNDFDTGSIALFCHRTYHRLGFASSASFKRPIGQIGRGRTKCAR